MPTTVGGGIASWLGGAGVSTGVASAVGTAATAIGTAAIGAYASKALAPKPDKQTPVQPLPLGSQDKPQAAKEVDLSAIQKKNAQLAAAAGQLGGANSTLLTSASGIASDSLNLGKSTLLGQ